MDNLTTVSSIFTTNNNNNASTTVSPFRNAIDYCALPRKPINTTVFSFLLVFIPITVVGNFSVAFIILTSQTLRKQTTFLFLASLAITDTLIGSITMPINAKLQWHSERFCMPETVCWIFLFVEPFLSMSSVVHLFVISIDRYVSLKYVYRYNTWMTRRRVSYVILSIWVCAVLLSLSNIVKWEHGPTGVRWTYIYNGKRHLCAADNQSFYILMYVGCFGVPLIIMLYTYSYVYRTAMRHINEISRTEISMGENNTQDSFESTRERKLKERQFRMLRSIIFVFIVFFVCWFPTIVYILSIFYAKSFWVQFRKDQWFIVMHFTLIQLLPPLNSTTNPFIYVLANRQFRNVAKQLFWKLAGNDDRAKGYIHSMFTSKASPKMHNKLNHVSQTNVAAIALSTSASTNNLKKSATMESGLYCETLDVKSCALMASTL